MLYVHTQTKKRSGSTTHRHQPADDWHQSHRQLQQMQHVSFSFNNDNNEKEKNNIYYICFFVLLYKLALRNVQCTAFSSRA